MKIDTISKKDNKIRLIVDETTPAFMNTLRRVLVTEVPTMAIEEVGFTKNSSALYDEILAHRLGLIPLSTDLKTYNLPDKCKCKGKGCNLCQAKLTLNAKGPKTVYSGDIKPKDPKVKPIHKEIPIVKLNKNQELKFAATAILGKGKEHTKWSTGLLVFQGYPKIRIISDKARDKDEILKTLPKMFEMSGSTIKIKDLSSPDLSKALDLLDVNENIEITNSKEKFIVDLESWGQLDPTRLLSEATDSMTAKSKAFQKLIK